MDWGCLFCRSQLDVSEVPEAQLNKQEFFLRVAVKIALGKAIHGVIGKEWSENQSLSQSHL
jgi:hypothetical protein